MLRKLLWKLIKIPLSPLFTALYVFRKIKGAVSAIIGGSKTAANTAASASKRASEAASNATTDQAEETGDEAATEPRPERPREPDESREHRRPERAADAEAERRYDRFERLLAGYAAYLFLLPFISVLLWDVPFRYISVVELFSDAVVGALVPAGLSGIARIRSKATWGIAFGVTALLFGLQALSLVGIMAIDSVGPVTTWTGIGPSQPLLFVLALAEIGLLGASLRAGWGGRNVVLEAGSTRTATPDAGVASTERVAPDATGQKPGQHSSAERTTARGESGSTATDTADRTDTETAAPTATGTETAAPTATGEDVDRDVDPSDAVESTATAATDDEPATGSGDSAESDPDRTGRPATTSDAEPGSGDSAESGPDRDAGEGTGETPADEVETAVERIEPETATPDAVRSFGDDLPDDDLPRFAATTLESLADRDDPNVRLAVCDVCATVDDERADDILKRCRIDPDDRVSDRAIEALR